MDSEMENLRLQIRDRDLEIIDMALKLRDAEARVKAMRNCENCKHFLVDVDVETCMMADEVCTLPELESWEPKE